MSIQTEITRLNGIKTTLQSDQNAIANAISEKGVTVPSGSGFDDFSSLIGNIHDLKIAYFEENAETTTTESNPVIKQYLNFELDFEPKAFFFKCNGSNLISNLSSVLSDFMDGIRTTYSNAVGYSLLSAFCIYSGFDTILTGNVPNMIWLYNSPSSADAPEVSIVNNANLLTKTQNTQTGKWNVTLGLADSGSPKRYYRFILPTSNAKFQIYFLG